MRQQRSASQVCVLAQCILVWSSRVIGCGVFVLDLGLLLGLLLDRVPVCLLAHRRRNPHDADFFGALRARFDVAERVVSTGGGVLVPEDVELFAVRRRNGVVC